MGFSRQEYWSGFPCPPPGDLPDPGSNPHLLCLLHWQVGSLPLVLPQFSSVQLLSRVQLFATPWTAAHQASLSITNSQSPPKFMCIESVMPSTTYCLLMKVREESEKAGLKLNIQKMKIMASGPITSWQIDWETMEIVTDFIFFPGGSVSKESAHNAGDPGSIPGTGRSPWRRKWQPTSVFWPGEFHGQRSLGGYSPRGHKELDTTEWQHIRTKSNVLTEARNACLGC